MQDNSSKFISNMQQLQDSVAKYVAAIDQQVCVTGLLQARCLSQFPPAFEPVACALQVERVEVENLRAVGLRNKMAAMHEVGTPGKSRMAVHHPLCKFMLCLFCLQRLAHLPQCELLLWPCLTSYKLSKCTGTASKAAGDAAGAQRKAAGA